MLSIIRGGHFSKEALKKMAQTQHIRDIQLAMLIIRILLRTRDNEIIKNSFMRSWASLTLGGLDLIDFKVLLTYVDAKYQMVLETHLV